MKFLQLTTRLLPLSALLLVAALNAAEAQKAKQPAKQQTKEYQPTSGQPGKDVVWVPTSQALVDKMLDMAKVTPEDFVVDLGSGDGRTVITAAKRGARALGIEYNPDLVALSRRNAAKEGVANRAQFMRADIFKSDFSRATVITLFLLPDLNVKLRPTILDMKPGVRVVSNSFTMGDWTADEQATITEGCTSYCTAFFWIVPAKVQGTWKTADGELVLEQKYQMLSGTLKSGQSSQAINEGRMIGDWIEFSAGEARYIGRVNGNVIEGIVKSPTGAKNWRATRVTKAMVQPRTQKQRPAKQRAGNQRADERTTGIQAPLAVTMVFDQRLPNAVAPMISTTSPTSTPANGDRRMK
ncbi:MAG TPA: class I SAM-dependent methyltransferase [Xanthobacteraceae bacterium]|nr:class I SAM-dependent methyltransferase [Xanthobacteraceae bacterium]